MEYLKGSGHFAVGFAVGFIIMLIVQLKYKHSLNVQMYAPFLPFILGIWSMLPYFFLSPHYSASWLNIFVFYDLVHSNEYLAVLFGRIVYVAGFCGMLYSVIVIRYIRLVKHCRRYGWHNGAKHA